VDDTRTPLTPADRNRAVNRVLFTILWLNLVVAVAKAVYGWWSGSLAVATDAVHSLLDAGSNVVALVAIRFASQPADPKHPYGHAKYEIIAALAIGALIAVGAVRFAWTAIDALLNHGEGPKTPAVGFAVIGATLVVNIFVSAYEARKGKELRSPLLTADATHTASDVLVTGAVLVALVVARLGVGWADPLVALVVVVVIGGTALRILSANLGVLVDRRAVDPERVVEAGRSVAGVRGIHRVRSRGTEQLAHVDLHLQLDGTLSLREAHGVAHKVEAAIVAAIEGVEDVTIHVEPHDDVPEAL